MVERSNKREEKSKKTTTLEIITVIETNLTI